jgi:hypothetical protein
VAVTASSIFRSTQLRNSQEKKLKMQPALQCDQETAHLNGKSSEKEASFLERN